MEKQVEIYCSRSSFGVARVLAGIGVFLSHSFFCFHEWFGFFSVAVFFFISGYGMEITHSRMRALVRLPRFISVFLFFMLLYYFVYGVWFYPTAWFLLAYMLLMVLYRFFAFSSIAFYLSFVLVFGILKYIGFEYAYWLDTWGFVMGYFVARSGKFFSWKFSIFLLSFFMIFFPPRDMILFVFFFPLFFKLFFMVTSLSFLSFLSSYSYLVFPFFSVHCWYLGLFGSTWTLDEGQFSGVIYVLVSFVLSLLSAWLLYRYVPIFSKKKFWIFQ